ncbi:MAG: ribosome biogenesis GTP-binding protein YihA/YsxC [Burkholderiaceae bacterium]|jgi:GTP-binding protein
MLNNFHSAQFEVSAAKYHQCPSADVPEIAFVGRSNAGKSTTVNTLCNQRQLAYASKTPGRTQLLNFFSVQFQGAPIMRLVDLPGYGFAQLAQQEQNRWDRELSAYLADRPSLVGCVMIVDARRGLLPLDSDLLDWVFPRRLPIHIVLSKADKLSKQAATLCLQAIRQNVQLRIDAGHPITVQLWSALKKQGIDTLELQLKHWIGHAPDNEPAAQDTP